MLIRDAFPHELAEVGELRVTTYVEQSFLSEDSSYVPTLRGMGTSGEGRVLVAVEAGAIVGTATLLPFTSDSEVARSPREVEMRALAVAPRAQGRGVGRLLLRAALDRAHASGARYLVLSTQSTMATAQRLYVSEGFERLPERDRNPRPGLLLLAYGRRTDRAGNGG